MASESGEGHVLLGWWIWPCEPHEQHGVERGVGEEGPHVGDC